MSSTFFSRFLRMVVLLFTQVLVLNQVHLLGYITPLLIGYMMVCFHQGTSRIAALLWGFAIGLTFDMFSNTAGMGAAACTLVAMIQQPVLKMFTPRDAVENFTPTFQTLGFWSYLSYVFMLMFTLHATFYLLDAFSLADWQLTLYSIAGGTLVSSILTLFVELLVRPRKE